MEFHDTVSDATLIADVIQAALESSKVDGGNGKTDEGGIKEKVKDEAIGYIIGGTLGGLATVAGAACLCFWKRVRGQTDEIFESAGRYRWKSWCGSSSCVCYYSYW